MTFFLQRMRLFLLFIAVAVTAASHHKDLKRDHIGVASFGDPYGSIGAVLPPVSGAPMQAGVSEDDIIPAGEDDLTGRYEIPADYNHHVAKHSDHLSLDSHPIHLSAHPIPFHGHGSAGHGHFEALCHEGYENFCYSPYNGFHEYGAPIDHNFGLDHGVSTHHGHGYHGHGNYLDEHYSLDAYPTYVGNVLTNSEALRLGFDKSYLKKLGFDGKVWHHSHNWAGLHGGVHVGGVGIHGHMGGACRVTLDIAFLVDGSTEKSNFGKFIDFISAVLSKLSISESGSRIALLTFAEKGELRFGFDRYLSNQAAAVALHDIKDKFTKKDGRKLGDGLKVAKTDLFDVSGRDEKHKILVVLTDGAAGDSFNEYAQALRDAAVSIYLVGPKANLKTDQIKGIVSDKDEWFSYITEDYDKMIKEVAPAFPPVRCTADVVFVIDCTQGEKTKLDKIKAFIRNSISGLSIGTRGDHVAVVTYGGRSEVKFNLNKKSHPGKVQMALQELECGKGGAADGAPALAQVRDVFDKSGHQGSINVTIYVSGSKTASNLAEPARALRNMGVRLYAVGYGKEASEDDLKKIASLPSDYFVHVKDDEEKFAISVGPIIQRHLSDVKGAGYGFGGGHGYGHLIGGSRLLHTLGGLGGIGEYGGWGAASYLRSGIEPQDDFSDLQNLQDDTAKVLKEVSTSDAGQDGFSTSLSQRLPELNFHREFSDEDQHDLEDTIKEASGVDRDTIENESLLEPTFDALHEDSLESTKKKTSKDFKNKKRTVGSRSQRKMSVTKGKRLHKKLSSNRENIETTKNDTATQNNTIATGDNAEANAGNNATEPANANEATNSSSEVANKTEGNANADLNPGQNATSGQGNNTVFARGKVDPYSSIGSDVSSDESAPHMKLNMEQESSTESKSNNAAQQKKAEIKASDSSTSDVHNDVISTGYDYEASKRSSNVPAKPKVATAAKKHMTKAEVDSIENPVHDLVKSIFHKAAKNVMKDFSKSTGLKNVAQLLVKAAVHNAMLKRPLMSGALKALTKTEKKRKAKKKKQNAERRSPQKKKDPRAQNRTLKSGSDDLMEFEGEKMKKQQIEQKPSIVEDSKKRSEIESR